MIGTKLQDSAGTGTYRTIDFFANLLNELCWIASTTQQSTTTLSLPLRVILSLARRPGSSLSINATRHRSEDVGRDLAATGGAKTCGPLMQLINPSCNS